MCCLERGLLLCSSEGYDAACVVNAGPLAALACVHEHRRQVSGGYVCDTCIFVRATGSKWASQISKSAVLSRVIYGIKRPHCFTAASLMSYSPWSPHSLSASAQFVFAQQVIRSDSVRDKKKKNVVKWMILSFCVRRFQSVLKGKSGHEIIARFTPVCLCTTVKGL